MHVLHCVDKYPSHVAQLEWHFCAIIITSRIPKLTVVEPASARKYMYAVAPSCTKLTSTALVTYVVPCEGQV